MTVDTPLLHSDLPLPKYEGKVRDVYDLGDRLLIVATDRVSAFDVVMPTGVPDKGRILTQMSAFWFDRTHAILPNHFLRVIDSTDNPDLPVALGPEYVGRTTLARKAEPVRIEAIVRGYLAGSGWKDYQATGQICGIPIPEGMQESEPFRQPLFTPSTKAAEGHDENISYEQAVEIVGEDVANAVRVRALALFTYAHERARQAGFILADTKFEFGLAENEHGEPEVILIDEAITPDSSRFWDAQTYQIGVHQEPYDKQVLRDWLEYTGWNKQPPAPDLPSSVVAALRERYMTAFTRITGNDLIRA